MKHNVLRIAWISLLFATAASAQQHETTQRLTASDITQMERTESGAGTSGVVGIKTTILSGNPTSSGPYTIKLSIPSHTRIESHTHRDERSAVVISGVWKFGYGPHFNQKALKPLEPGSFYTEPAGEPHFAMTEKEPVVVYITGYGPTDTVYSH